MFLPEKRLVYFGHRAIDAFSAAKQGIFKSVKGALLANQAHMIAFKVLVGRMWHKPPRLGCKGKGRKCCFAARDPAQLSMKLLPSGYQKAATHRLRPSARADGEPALL